MKIRSSSLGVIIFVIIFGGILSTSILGIWKTEGTKTPRKISAGDYAGSYDPADIRGSYTFSNISKNYNIPIKDLGEAFGIKENVENFKVKELEGIYSELDVRTGSVRLFVALYTGLPFEIKEDIYLPQSAVDILKNKRQLTTEEITYIEGHTVRE